MEQDRLEQDQEPVRQAHGKPAVEWAAQERDKDVDAWADLVSAGAETVYVPPAVKKCRINAAFPARS
jgi:hypothetical protein